MNTDQITDKLDAINSKLNRVIGRLVMFRSIPEIKNSHELLLECGNDIDELINHI